MSTPSNDAIRHFKLLDGSFMYIKEKFLSDAHFRPGEVLTHPGGEYTHVTITYNISGVRSAVDNQIDLAVDEDSHLVKVDEVNTTLYWQFSLGNSEDSQEKLEKLAKKELKEKLKEIFVGDQALGNTTVNAFCMVGNLKAVAFEITD